MTCGGQSRRRRLNRLCNNRLARVRFTAKLFARVLKVFAAPLGVAYSAADANGRPGCRSPTAAHARDAELLPPGGRVAGLENGWAQFSDSTPSGAWKIPDRGLRFAPIDALLPPIFNGPCGVQLAMGTAVSRAQCVGDSLTTSRGLPRDGDVVVGREAHSAVTYTVRQVPGDVQFHSSVRDEAVRLARDFAQTITVDVWYSDDGMYRLLEAHRTEGA